jgi:hypothetical protein
MFPNPNIFFFFHSAVHVNWISHKENLVLIPLHEPADWNLDVDPTIQVETANQGSHIPGQRLHLHVMWDFQLFKMIIQLTILGISFRIVALWTPVSQWRSHEFLRKEVLSEIQQNGSTRSMRYEWEVSV